MGRERYLVFSIVYSPSLRPCNLVWIDIVPSKWLGLVRRVCEP